MQKKLFVGGISYNTTEDGLKEAFQAVGNVVSAQIIMDKMTGRSKGFGFVEMETEELAQKAIDTLNGTEIDGRKITVNESRPMKPRSDRGFGGRDRAPRF